MPLLMLPPSLLFKLPPLAVDAAAAAVVNAAIAATANTTIANTVVDAAGSALPPASVMQKSLFALWLPVVIILIDLGGIDKVGM
jgi:hypothetical protein